MYIFLALFYLSRTGPTGKIISSGHFFWKFRDQIDKHKQCDPSHTHTHRQTELYSDRDTHRHRHTHKSRLILTQTNTRLRITYYENSYG